jgi:hypothetical protein
MHILHLVYIIQTMVAGGCVRHLLFSNSLSVMRTGEDMWVGRITALYFESFSSSRLMLPAEPCNTKTLVSQLYGIRIAGRISPMKTRLKSSEDLI